MHKKRSKKSAAALAVSADGRWVRSANGWSETPPTEGGTYWHWNGCQSCAPFALNVGMAGCPSKAMVYGGQAGLPHGIDCDEYGGWWMKIPEPVIPDMDHCHCDACDS